jgi:hypothetical protein
VNSDTRNKVEEIRKKRWYGLSDAMGPDGWFALSQEVRSWKTYVLLAPDQLDPVFEFRAEDDRAAREACSTTFSLGGLLLKERIVTYRDIEI